MRAVQYRTVGSEPEVVEIPTPEPGPGQVRLKVTAAGLCHSDAFVMSLPEGVYQLPLTLGHEGAGVVDALGDGVSGVELGQPVAVYGAWGCGRCHACARGAENYCPHAGGLGIYPPGLGAPGALAEYLIVDDARHLVPLGDLDPVSAVSLTDAGLTPYHAIVSSLGALPAGSTAVVIGVGGLGHVGIQILRAITGATVVALDLSDDKLKLAREVGAHRALHSDESAVAAIRELTGGVGAQAVFDFVGAAPTLEIARQTVAMDGVIQIVGEGHEQARRATEPVEGGERARHDARRRHLGRYGPAHLLGVGSSRAGRRRCRPGGTGRRRRTATPRRAARRPGGRGRAPPPPSGRVGAGRTRRRRGGPAVGDRAAPGYRAGRSAPSPEVR
ncbi:alcohol dehydrogenase catalytic domain-containing protein [Blastococcus sp. TML/M2B]|uniref:alcohol dehydrogenase catalytic domain-containing protein n=1 Tax=Blastococcus sp. TML/M2B TaxID=2798727 RepID=UPI001F5B0316|nr:alcohol dehydrogenase catalytic domain-containing protein [Blastococcus sp. TML/M2B]